MEHQTEVYISHAEYGEPAARKHYFACDTCGACGTMQVERDDAAIEAADHRKWARLNDPS